MDSKMKELSMEEMDMITGGLEVTNPYIIEGEDKNLIPIDPKGNRIKPKES